MQCSLDYLALELTPTDTRRGLDSSCTLKFLPALLDHIKRHRNILVKNLDSAAAGLIQRNLRKTIDGLVIKEIQSSRYADGVEHGKVLFICGGLMAIIECWNDDDYQETADSILAKIDIQIKDMLRQ